MSTKKLISAYQPHAGQIAFHQSKAKFRAIMTGVGFGKSAAGANETIKAALEYPHAIHLVMAPNGRIMKNATLPQLFKFCPPELLLAHIKYENKILLKNGATIVYLTADNERHIDRLRGMEVGSAWLDEARLFLYLVWSILVGRLRDNRGPLRIWITTTPYGQFHWTYYLFVRKIDPETRMPLIGPENYEVFRGTTLENPHIPDEYKQTLLNVYHGSFKKQEVYGEFTNFEGQVYDNFTTSLHILDELPEGFVPKEWIVGIDHGFTNPRVGLIIALDGDDRAYVVAEYYRKQTHVEVLATWLTTKMEEHKITSWRKYADPSEPGEIMKLASMGHPCIPANNDVMPGITNVYNALSMAADGKPRLYILKNCEHTIEEMGRYRYADKHEGKMEKEEPVKVDDHAMDALRYAIHTHLGAAKPRIVVMPQLGEFLGLG